MKKKNPRYQKLVAGMTSAHAVGNGNMVYGNGVGVGASNLAYTSLGVGATGVVGTIGCVGNTGPIGPPGRSDALPPDCRIEQCTSSSNFCLYSKETGFRLLRNLCGDNITDISYTATGIYVRSSLIAPGFAVFPLLFPRMSVWDPKRSCGLIIWT